MFVKAAILPSEDQRNGFRDRASLTPLPDAYRKAAMRPEQA
jgi:hypothetical protein